MRHLICISLHFDCAALELSNKGVTNMHMKVVHSVSMNVQYMDEDLPPDVDQVLFPLVNGTICLKCQKAKSLLLPPP